ALCDLFMHGIGGAKYDQVTGRLIETFFDITPPGIMVLSATLHLPIQRPGILPISDATERIPDRRRDNADYLRDIRRELRELSYHPEKYLHANHLLDGESSVRLRALVDEKQRWIRTPVTPENAYARWDAFRRIN